MTALNAIKSHRTKRVVNAIARARAERSDDADDLAEHHVDLIRRARNSRVNGERGSMRITCRRGQMRMLARTTANGSKRFSGIAYTGGMFFPSITIAGRAETGATVLDLDTLRISSNVIPVLDDHDETPDGVIGKTDSIEIADYRLLVRGVIYSGKDRAVKFIQAANGGHNWQLSVGTDGFTLERVPDRATVRVNGQTFTGPLTIARNAYLTDLSFVAIGADDKTSATIAARRHFA